MATCAQPVSILKPRTPAPIYVLFMALAISMPLLGGLAWHQSSDNPAWPLLQNSLSLCDLRNSPLSPVSPNGLYRAHVVQATCFGRFSETLVFLTDASVPWSLANLDHNRAVVEMAGVRSLDAINWQESSDNRGTPVLQLWFVPGASPTQIHRMDRVWRGVTIQSLTSSPAPGAERLDY
jgi:hypothetical protein